MQTGDVLKAAIAALGGLRRRLAAPGGSRRRS
ncbi:hypothetical protein EV653_3360 [Kribbella pratensis]|uniref:Uncharacterized protein n=1 Tax=Kribbella pratensis TaxID=2512112 RepID=A0A4R8C0Y7_9ACTN|nr:hypothetical protein EV653_3360 [Kribbella pratensis]